MRNRMTWQEQIIGGFDRGLQQGIEETERQKALAARRQEQETERQRALNRDAFEQRLRLRAMGYNPDLNTIKQAMTGELADIQQAEAAPGFEGPPRPGLFDRRTDEYIQGQELARQRRDQEKSDRELDRRVKEAQIASYGQKQKIAEQKAAQPKEFKQNQYAAGGFAKRAEAAMSQLTPELVQGATGDVFEGSPLFPDMLKSPERKQLEQIQRNFISAVLRKESGAVISPQEELAEVKKYFPQVGDDPQTLAFKEQARNQAIANLKAEAGGAYGQIATAPPVQIAQPQPSQSFSLIPGASPLVDNTAHAANPEDFQKVIKGWSREQKMQYMLSGNPNQ